MVKKKKEVCKMQLEDGKEIKIEREVYDVIYYTSADEIVMRIRYYINGTKWFDSLEKELSDLLDVTILDLSDTFDADSDDDERLHYKIKLLLNEIDKLPNMLKELDDNVINTLKEVIEGARKIKEAIVNHF